MKYVNNKVEDLKIAYIGGGSRGWAWGLMSDLAMADDISGDVYLYDIDYEAAKNNETIGNKVKDLPDSKSVWNYKATKTIGEALTGANFVVISILPGTFKEMESDVHTPEKYGIYQSVGDTSGPGGLIRALRTVPMFEEIALAIKEYCPEAWVINYTNPMTVCTRTLYATFPGIKAFGCCHEVFGTQKLLVRALQDICGMPYMPREEIKVNVLGVNHFTWFDKAQFRDIDLFEVYEKFCDKYAESGYTEPVDTNWQNKMFPSHERVKMDLFKRFGLIAAAGDRHLAEFCPGKWYIENPEKVEEWQYKLTPVSFRFEDLDKRLARSKRLLSGEEAFVLKPTGEEGVEQMRALLGLRELITNVNIPNYGQVTNLPIGAVVETNATFRTNELEPVFVGDIPSSIYPLISRICGQQELTVEAAMERDLEKAFNVFANDPLVPLSMEDARKLFNEMVENTKSYLSDYFA